MKRYQLTFEARKNAGAFSDHTFSIMTLAEWERLGFSINQLEEIIHDNPVNTRKPVLEIQERATCVNKNDKNKHLVDLGMPNYLWNALHRSDVSYDCTAKLFSEKYSAKKLLKKRNIGIKSYLKLAEMINSTGIHWQALEPEELNKDYKKAVKQISKNRKILTEEQRNQLTINLIEREKNILK